MTLTKVLVAEDDAASRRLVVKCIERLGYIAVQASNGRRALSMLMDNPDIRLLITDIMMPEMDGRELVGILRGNEQFVRLPVIMISAVAELPDLEGILKLGAVRFVQKPIDTSGLRDLLKTLL